MKVGQELDVFVKDVDQEHHRISLSVKDTQPDPWFDRAGRYEEGQIIEGKVNPKDKDMQALAAIS